MAFSSSIFENFLNHLFQKGGCSQQSKKVEAALQRGDVNIEMEVIKDLLNIFWTNKILDVG